MRESWQQRIDRACDLAERDEAARPLLEVYGRLLGLQRDCDETLRLRADRLSGTLESDLALMRPCIAPLLSALTSIGPPQLAEQAGRMLEGDAAAIDAMLLGGWHARRQQEFLPKIALQPYGQLLAAIGVRPLDRHLPKDIASCPFCGGAPQLAILEDAGADHGGGRSLLCAMCFTVWPFRRVLCAHCGEEDEHRLGYYRAPAFEHLRVDACDTCRHYLKTVDLTRLGIAVPVVDELAGAALDLWAIEHGYQKIELNLVGL
jgi:FdhE protein